MTINKRSKNSRQRGSHTHGWGSKKKHRGAGNRGGRGAAGTGKRGDAKKPSIWHITRYFGPVGFVSRAFAKETITLRTLEDVASTWVENEWITINKDVYEIDLTDLGYDKLLSTGNVKKRWKIKVEEATPKTIQKVQEGGGSVELPQQKDESA